MKFKILTFFTILPILCFLGCGSKEKTQEKTKKVEIEEKKLEKKIISYKLKTLENKEINIQLDEEKIILKEYPNKVVLLSFFASWCPPCLAEIPSLIKLQKIYKKNFSIIGVILEKNKTNEEIINFQKEQHINYPIVNSEENFKLSDGLGYIRSIPTMFLIDKEQNLYQKYTGIIPFPMLERDIKNIINQK